MQQPIKSATSAVNCSNVVAALVIWVVSLFIVIITSLAW